MEIKQIDINEIKRFLHNQMHITIQTGIALCLWINAYTPMMLMKQLKKDNILMLDDSLIQKVGIGCLIAMVIIGIAIVLKTQSANRKDQYILNKAYKVEPSTLKQLNTYYQKCFQKQQKYSTLGLIQIICGLCCILLPWLFLGILNGYIISIALLLQGGGLVLVSINGSLEKNVTFLQKNK